MENGCELLGDVSEAREIKAFAASIDSISFEDQVKAAIDQLNAEETARRVMRIKRAFQGVKK